MHVSARLVECTAQPGACGLLDPTTPDAPPARCYRLHTADGASGLGPYCCHQRRNGFGGCPSYCAGEVGEAAPPPWHASRAVQTGPATYHTQGGRLCLSKTQLHQNSPPRPPKWERALKVGLPSVVCPSGVKHQRGQGCCSIDAHTKLSAVGPDGRTGRSEDLGG